jgi:hypothetical protein
MPEEASGTSRGPSEILEANLVDDLRLTAKNIRSIRKAYKELYDFTMVSSKYLSACMLCRLVLTRSPPL